jgi:hypothetical protein
MESKNLEEDISKMQSETCDEPIEEVPSEKQLLTTSLIFNWRNFQGHEFGHTISTRETPTRTSSDDI